MDLHLVRYSKGQFKIQQMVFILVAIIILFGIVSVLFVSIRFGSLKTEVNEQRKEAVYGQVRNIAATPEFNWISSNDCAACVDLDKVFLLKNRTAYQGFWTDISLLKISRIYPTYEDKECTSYNYPDCNTITLVDEGDFEAYESFISLCRFDGKIKQTRCELGKIVMGFKNAQ